MEMRLASLSLVAALVGSFGTIALAEEFQVKMLNKGEAGTMVFEPAFVQGQVGDTVRFIPVDKGHNAETVKGMIPDGVEPMIGKADEEIVLTLTQDGVWGIRCKPHYGLGMVALIVAGDPVNLEAAKAAKNPGKAKKVFDELFEKIGAN
jgi:pseudoazurin